MAEYGLGGSLAQILSDAPLNVFDALDSTKEEARRRAALSSDAGWLLALRQTDGRGRRGREWQALPGNLSLTGYAFHAAPISMLPNLSFVAALAAFDAAAVLLGGAHDLSLKWPNDLLFRRRKLAGLLLESGTGIGGANWVSVSIGMNLAAAPEAQAIGQAAASIAEAAPAPDPRNAAIQFKIGLSKHLATLEQDGFATIRRIWLERTSGIGQSIKVQLPNETLNGVFDGLSDDGSLIVRLPNGGERLITAGDVYFEAAQTDQDDAARD
jgi:BirA family transcriptional regulator, biotin operon repressor / biotin---[acetyl-CoA-carboxylase] ligase